MLGAVVMAFFTCLLPFRVLTLWIIIAPDEYLQGMGVESYYNALYFCRIMLYLNSAINPILYNLMSSKFRKGFKKLFYCYCLFKICNRDQHKFNLFKRYQNSHTLTSNTNTTSLTTNSRKNSSKLNASLNDLNETKILTNINMELHHDDDDDDDPLENDDNNNVEREIEFTVVENRKVIVNNLMDKDRVVYLRQKSQPMPLNRSHRLSSKPYHRHTIHINDAELSRMIAKRKFFLLRTKNHRLKKDRHIVKNNSADLKPGEIQL